VQIDQIKDNPAHHVQTPKIEKKIPNFIQENKIEKLMNLPNKRSLIGKRDHAILELFYATGIRLSELVGLNIGSVNSNENLLKVIGKGNKERIVPFGDKSKNAMQEYLKDRGHSWNADPITPLFTGTREKRISVRTVQDRLCKYLQQILGGKKGASPHTLRHTFGTHLLDNDADIRSIQELLGHSSISSTQIYTKVNPEKIKKIYKNAHPHAS
jgi:site-specific recombinase XerD